MEKLFKPYDMEFMRMAMLKHEETFKEQVYELHRLYRIQKILMKNIESSKPNGRNQDLWNSNNGINFKQASQNLHTQHKLSMKLDLEQPADDFIAESNGDGMLEVIDESEIELTLGPTNYSRKKKPETPRNSRDSGRSFCSSSTGSSHINRTNIIRAREALTGCEPGLVHQVPEPEAQLRYQSGSKNNNEKQYLRQQEILDQQQPPWLLQVLSFNMA